MQKTLGIFKLAAKQTENWLEVCGTIPCVPTPGVGCIDAPRTTCSIIPTGVSTGITVAFFAAETVFEIVERFNGEYCEPNGALWETSYQTLRQDAIYNNAITNARNIITTFAATQQLKVMLGDVQTGLEADREERDDQGRRLQSDDCVDTSLGFQIAPCLKVSCQDPVRLCDKSYNYPYISELITGWFIMLLLLAHL